ncbi:unnamed protein product, partial [Amoebophrya sp. A120]
TDIPLFNTEIKHEKMGGIYSENSKRGGHNSKLSSYYDADTYYDYEADQHGYGAGTGAGGCSLGGPQQVQIGTLQISSCNHRVTRFIYRELYASDHLFAFVRDNALIHELEYCDYDCLARFLDRHLRLAPKKCRDVMRKKMNYYGQTHYGGSSGGNASSAQYNSQQYGTSTASWHRHYQQHRMKKMLLSNYRQQHNYV